MERPEKTFDSYTKPVLPTQASEDLDQPLIVVSTKNWLALFAILLLVFLTILWLMMGSIPVVVQGQAFYWETGDEKVIYGALPVELGQKVRENFPVLMHVSGVDQQKYGQLKGEVIKNFMVPMNLEELQKNIPHPPLAPFLMGKNQAVVLIKIQPLMMNADNESKLDWTSAKGVSWPLPSESTGEISIRIATLKPIQYVVPSFGD